MRGQEAFAEVLDVLGGPLRGLGGHPGCPRGLRRPSWRSGRGKKALLEFQDALPEVLVALPEVRVG